MATGFIANESQLQRYANYFEYYDRKKAELGCSQIIVIDDGTGNEWLDLLTREVPLTVIDALNLPDKLPAGNIWLRFPDNLGRPTQTNSRGWWRSFSFAGVVARKYGFSKIIHIESDSYVISPRMFDFLRTTKCGWFAPYCRVNSYPDSCIQVIQGEHIKTLKQYYLKGQGFWESGNKGKPLIPELSLPFTDVLHCFNGDRYGEDSHPTLPEDIDYASNMGGNNEVVKWAAAAGAKMAKLNDRLGLKSDTVTAHHGHKAGDAIYAIPTMRKLNIGTIVLNPASRFDPAITQESCEFLKPLLESQGFEIEIRAGAEYDCNYNLDDFRLLVNSFEIEHQHLSLSYAKAFMVNIESSQPYLHLDHGKGDFDIIIQVSSRYHDNNWKKWRELLKDYNEHRTGFIGTHREYEVFLRKTGGQCRIQYIAVNDALEMAQYISGAKLFFGNQSLGFAIAEALKKPRILEASMSIPNCIPQTSNSLMLVDDAQIDKARNFINFYLGVDKSFTHIWEESTRYVIQQKPEEFMPMLKFVNTNVPHKNNALVIGTNTGGTTYAIAQLFRHTVSVDIEKKDGWKWDIYGAEFWTMDTHTQEFRERLKGREFDFIFIDGDHGAEGVTRDFLVALEVLAPGGLIAFHDVLLTDWHMEQGCYVHEIWEQIKREGYKWKEFVALKPQDNTYERHPWLVAMPDYDQWGGIGVISVSKTGDYGSTSELLAASAR